MSLLDAQQDFTAVLARWILAAYARGYRCTLGAAYQEEGCDHPPRSPHSYHRKRLAVDVNLFDSDGTYLQTLEQWQDTGLGSLWVMLGGSWGGNFTTGSVGDANHLSWGEQRD